MTQRNGGQQEASLHSVVGGPQPHQAEGSGTLFCFSSVSLIAHVITQWEDYLVTDCPLQVLTRARELIGLSVSPQRVGALMGYRAHDHLVGGRWQKLNPRGNGILQLFFF